MMLRRLTIRLLAISLAVFIADGTSRAGDGQPLAVSPELLATVRGTVQAILPLGEGSRELVLATQNPGADCGRGTPASIWKITLDPANRQLVCVEKKQDLTKIQSVRYALFKSSRGTLFSGGGWCNYKPPYFSTDGGETWKPAHAGPVHPPNSTFSFVEFAGNVYAGTGYEPHHGQVYRWLGEGNWRRVLDIPPPRSIVERMVVHDDRLFVASHIYGWGGRGRENSVPVYVSTNGEQFEPTEGIPPSCTVREMLVVGGRLIAWAYEHGNAKQRYVYAFSGNSWRNLGDLSRDVYPARAAAYGDCMIFGRTAKGCEIKPGLCVSTDMGLVWNHLATIEGICTLKVHGDTLYLAATVEGQDVSHIYRVELKDYHELVTSGRDCGCRPTDEPLVPTPANDTGGLVLYLPLDEPGGEIADRSGHGNDGTLHGATYTDGRSGGGYHLGNNRYIAIPNRPSLEVTTGVTVATWAKLKSFGPHGYGNEYGYLIDKGNDLWWNPAFCLGYAKSSSTPPCPGESEAYPALFHIGDDQSAGNRGGKTVRSETRLECGRWYHLVGTYDGETVRLYLNGRLESEVAFGKPIRSDNAPIHLGGGKLYGTGWGNHFTTDAVIDDVRIHNRALSGEEVRLLYESEQ